MNRSSPARVDKPIELTDRRPQESGRPLCQHPRNRVLTDRAFRIGVFEQRYKEQFRSQLPPRCTPGTKASPRSSPRRPRDAFSSTRPLLRSRLKQRFKSRSPADSPRSQRCPATQTIVEHVVVRRISTVRTLRDARSGGQVSQPSQACSKEVAHRELSTLQLVLGPVGATEWWPIRLERWNYCASRREQCRPASPFPDEAIEGLHSVRHDIPAGFPLDEPTA